VDPDELVRWAEAQGSNLPSGIGARWHHVQAVAARAHEAGRILDEDDRAALVAAA
jgi:hypothetical protein